LVDDRRELTKTLEIGVRIRLGFDAVPSVEEVGNPLASARQRAHDIRRDGVRAVTIIEALEVARRALTVEHGIQADPVVLAERGAAEAFERRDVV